MTIYIIGGGLAGLSAAYYANKAGFNVSLFESSNHLGGKCFSFFDKELNTEIDNGTHFISGANSHFFDLMSNCQKFSTLSDLGTSFNFYNDSLNTFKIDLDFPLSILKNWEKVYSNLIESILNTPKENADKKLFFKTLIRCYLAKNRHFYTPQKTLKESIIQPLQSFLENKIEIHLSKQVLSYNEQEIKLKNTTIYLKKDDFIISTTPQVKNDYETILNIYYKTEHKLPNQDHVLGLSQCTGHWIIQKENLLSVVVSAANKYKNIDIASQIWDEISPILATKIKIPIHKVIQNKKATISQTKNTIRVPQKYGKIIYAGDSTRTGLPCTIEGAILSGKNAINLINTKLGLNYKC